MPTTNIYSTTIMLLIETTASLKITLLREHLLFGGFLFYSRHANDIHCSVHIEIVLDLTITTHEHEISWLPYSKHFSNLIPLRVLLMYVLLGDRPDIQ